MAGAKINHFTYKSNATREIQYRSEVSLPKTRSELVPQCVLIAFDFWVFAFGNFENVSPKSFTTRSGTRMEREGSVKLLLSCTVPL